MPYLYNAVVSAKSLRSLVALKLLVSLIGRLVACSARIVIDKQTDKQTHRPNTVTLAAHVCRGLMKYALCAKTLRNKLLCKNLSLLNGAHSLV